MLFGAGHKTLDFYRHILDDAISQRVKDAAERDVVKHHRNSAQLVVATEKISIKERIEKYEIEQRQSVSSCSIVVTEAMEDLNINRTDRNANRLSTVSESSAESIQDDVVEEHPVNVELGSSKFYVNWD